MVGSRENERNERERNTNSRVDSWELRYANMQHQHAQSVLGLNVTSKTRKTFRNPYVGYERFLVGSSFHIARWMLELDACRQL